MKKRTKRILLGVGLGSAAVVAAQKLLANNLIDLALDREPPKNIEESKKKAAGSDKHLKVLHDMQDLSDRLENSGCEVVNISARDGINLVGHYYRCEHAKRVIIAMHGWRSSWSRDFGCVAEFWHQNDCSVLYAEQRGQNASEGEYMGFGITERYDCLDWANYIHERTGGSLPVYLAGVSMGATTVLMAAGQQLPECVHGIIADCGFTSPKAIWKHVVQGNLHIPYSFVEESLDKAYQQIADAESDYSCESALKDCKVPVLFIHGTDDRFVPIEMTYDNYKACAARKRLFIVPGAEHGMSYFEDKEGYEKTVRQFWADYDTAASMQLEDAGTGEQK